MIKHIERKEFTMKNLFLLAILTTFFPLLAHAETCGTSEGISIPCWRTYLDGGNFVTPHDGNESLPFFPYAKRQNGCSIPGGRPGLMDNLQFTYAEIGYKADFREVCNAHDRCYYSPNDPGASECNAAFAAGLHKVCAEGLKSVAGVLVGTAGATAVCFAKANSLIMATVAVQDIYYKAAQENERLYLLRVKEFVVAHKTISATYRGYFTTPGEIQTLTFHEREGNRLQIRATQGTNLDDLGPVVFDENFSLGQTKACLTGLFTGGELTEIACIYDYGSLNTGLLVFSKTVGGLKVQPWWTSGAGNMNPAMIQGFNAGDFTGSGATGLSIDYRYPDGSIRNLIFSSNGQNFTLQP